VPRARTTGAAPTVSPSSDPTPADAIVTDPVAAAKSAFKRGQNRLKADDLEGAIVELARAVELQPAETDYAATLAWARFCHAPDKPAFAQATREALNKAIRKSPTPELAQFYLGRVERMLGRDKEALRLFQEVLEAQPKHADAAAEIRVIEARLAESGGRDSGGGLFGRRR
jgi:cytochrome c-type biogenesis protein CcmH/NrfG